MKFGGVPSVKGIDLSLPPDHPDTARMLRQGKRGGPPRIAIGCAKWNKQDLANFYPRGTKDELAYYAMQFNSIELNATFYRFFPPQQFTNWADKVPDGYRFYPKVTQDISHFRRLFDTSSLVEDYTEAVRHLRDRLGAVFLQMHENFKPKDISRVESFLRSWPKDIPLGLEFRHTDWYNNATVADQLYLLLEEHRVMNIITDTAERRDLLHMRLTTTSAFVRYVEPTTRRATGRGWMNGWNA